jgi:hypothetical protein
MFTAAELTRFRSSRAILENRNSSGCPVPGKSKKRQGGQLKDNRQQNQTGNGQTEKQVLQQPLSSSLSSIQVERLSRSLVGFIQQIISSNGKKISSSINSVAIGRRKQFEYQRI